MPASWRPETRKSSAWAMLPSRPTSSRAKPTSSIVAAGCSPARAHAISSIPATPLALSSAPGVPATVSKCAPTTKTRSGVSVPKRVAITFSLPPPAAW